MQCQIKTNNMNDNKTYYLVGDTNGTFISQVENEKTTSNLDNAKRFETIGDAMKECVEYNKNAITFRVISVWYANKERKK